MKKTDTTKAKSILRTMLINFSILSTIIVAIECIALLKYGLDKDKFYYNRTQDIPVHNRIFEDHPFLAGRLKASISITQDGKTITTTSINTRETGSKINPKKNKTIIATVGGSTTFGTGVTDKDSWPFILQKKLGEGYTVINYGVPGYSTAENLIQTALILPEIPPDIVIFYEGWNDIRNYHEKNLGPEFYTHGIRQRESFNLATSKKTCNEPPFATLWLIDNLKIKKQAKKEYSSPTTLYTTPDPFVDKIYTRNLKTIKHLTQKMKAVPIFIPQILNNHKFTEEGKSEEWSRNIENKAMPKLLQRFNKIMATTCISKKENCIYLKSVLSENWNSNDFVDNGHFSKKGGEKFADYVYQKIKALTTPN